MRKRPMFIPVDIVIKKLLRLWHHVFLHLFMHGLFNPTQRLQLFRRSILVEDFGDGLNLSTGQKSKNLKRLIYTRFQIEKIDVIR
jgi:hypothetical protein